MKSEQQQPQAGMGKLGLCSGCSYFPGHLNANLCTPGDACIRAHSGRQIDRFLRNNPELAGAYLADLFWERRAIARGSEAQLLPRATMPREAVSARELSVRLMPSSSGPSVIAAQ